MIQKIVAAHCLQGTKLIHAVIAGMRNQTILDTIEKSQGNVQMLEVIKII
jgi:hypothetical protein